MSFWVMAMVTRVPFTVASSDGDDDEDDGLGGRCTRFCVALWLIVLIGLG